VTAAWLAARELRVRWRRAALAGAIVAALSAASTATELVARAREEAVAGQIDRIGPALTVIPAGLGPGALARLDLAGRLLPRGVGARVAAALGPDLRSLDERLVLTRDISGARAPVIGVGPGSTTAPPSTPDGALLGAELARRLGPPLVSVAGQPFQIAGVLPSAGSAEDVAAFIPLASAQALAGAEGSINEIRVYLRAGVAPSDAESLLRTALPGAEVVRTDRGEVADTTTQASLARHRAAAYAVMAIVAALCLAIAAHLDAAERRVELATLSAIGAGRRVMLGAVLARSAAVASAGALAGVVVGTALAAGHVPDAVGILWRSPGVTAATVAAAAAIGVLAAVPTGLAAALRDPVPDLQLT
jgi:hypothetical protein